MPVRLALIPHLTKRTVSDIQLMFNIILVVFKTVNLSTGITWLLTVLQNSSVGGEGSAGGEGRAKRLFAQLILSF